MPRALTRSEPEHALEERIDRLRRGLAGAAIAFDRRARRRAVGSGEGADIRRCDGAAVASVAIGQSVVVPDMRYEAAMWFILPAGLIGMIGVPLLVRRVLSRRTATR